MSQLNLDPHPLNELGKGILAPDVEAKLLAEGVIFATTVTPRNPKVPPYLVTCRRSIVEASTDAWRDLHQTVARQRVPSIPALSPAEFVPA